MKATIGNEEVGGSFEEIAEKATPMFHQSKPPMPSTLILSQKGKQEFLPSLCENGLPLPCLLHT